MNFDKSTILEDLLTKDFDNQVDILLGELQFAFVSFLLGQNFDSFEQWKQLVLLLTQCDAALITQYNLFFKLIPVIYE